MNKLTPGPWKLETAPGGPNAGWCISVRKARDNGLKNERYIILAQRSAIDGEEFAANAVAMSLTPDMVGLLGEAAFELSNYELLLGAVLPLIYEGRIPVPDVELPDCEDTIKSEKVDVTALVNKIHSLLRRIEGDDAE